MLQLLEIIIGPVFGVIDKLLGNSAEAAKLKSEIQKVAYENAAKELDARKDILVAELQGESPAQRNWRPHLMYMAMGLIIYIAVFAPILEAGTGWNLDVGARLSETPDALWNLLMIGIGGYIGGRSIEKTAKTIAPAIRDGVAGKTERKLNS